MTFLYAFLIRVLVSSSKSSSIIFSSSCTIKETHIASSRSKYISYAYRIHYVAARHLFHAQGLLLVLIEKIRPHVCNKTHSPTTYCLCLTCSSYIWQPQICTYQRDPCVPNFNRVIAWDICVQVVICLSLLLLMSGLVVYKWYLSLFILGVKEVEMGVMGVAIVGHDDKWIKVWRLAHVSNVILYVTVTSQLTLHLLE